MAKNAAKEKEEIEYGVITTDISIFLKERIYHQWQETYDQPEKGVQYKSIQSMILKKPRYSKINRSRQFFSTIMQLTTNYARVPSMLFRMNLVESSLCLCGQVMDIDHILSKPLLLTMKCDVMLNKLTNLDYKLDLEPKNLLSLDKTDVIKMDVTVDYIKKRVVL